MKKVGCIGIALLCITFVFVVFYLINNDHSDNNDHPDYELNDFSDASEEEREAISLFYADDSSPISEGKYFDIKYANFSSAKTGNIRFEMIKKNTANVTFESVNLKDNTGMEGITMTFYGGISYDLSKGFPGVVRNLASDKSFKYYCYCDIASLTLEPDFDQFERLDLGYLTQEYIERNFPQITISFNINGEADVYDLRYDEEKRFLYTKECKEKVLAGEKNRYYGVQASYYYSTLFYRDFEQWKVEIEQALASGVDKVLDTRVILNFPSLEVSAEKENIVPFQELLKLNDEEFEEYLAIVKKFVDLGYYVPNYIKVAI